MKIKSFADSQGVSIGRMNRAAIWALSKTGREKPSKGGRYAGVELTIEEQALCLKYLIDHQKGKEVTPEPMKYELARLGWMQTWIDAYQTTEESRRKVAILAVVSGLLMAKDRAWLDGACDGARNGDLLVELSYTAQIDFEARKGWKGFTGYLLENGFESHGWDIL